MKSLTFSHDSHRFGGILHGFLEDCHLKISAYVKEKTCQ